MRPLKRMLLLLAGSALSALAGFAAVAAPIPFSGEPASYDLQEESLANFLERLFADESIRVQLSPGVQNQTGTLNGPRRGAPAEIFRSVLDSYRLAAYFDGSTVHVYRRDELVSRFFVVQSERVPQFLSAVRQMGLSNEFNSVRVTEDTGLVSAQGAPHFVEQVAQLAEAIGQRRDAVQTVFRFFPLKYAWATDRSFVVGNRQVTVPGVATILQQLLEDRSHVYGGYGSNFQMPNEAVLPSTVQSLNGQGLASLGNNLRNDAATRLLMPDANGGLRMVGGQNGGAQQQLPQVVSISGGTARIVADPYRNAVIVRDLPERIELYEELVRSLDIETSILEIEATIIDVDTDKLRRLGVEWRYATGSTEGVFGGEGSKDDFLGALLSGNIAALGQVPGFQLGAIIGDDDRFIARVNALQQEGAMRVVSRPRVATINDVEAVIESSREIYVPVEGAFQVDLFNVYAGTVLRVTPHLISDANRERIRLLVTVEDGDIRLNPDLQDTEVPEVVRNAVTTQAIIDAGQSLLLGGLVRDAARTTVTKVPVLGDIPVIGELFKSRSREAERTERMFLISPRLIDLQRPQELPANVPELYQKNPPPPNQPPPPSKLPQLPPPDWPPAQPQSAPVPAPPEPVLQPAALPQAEPLPPPQPVAPQAGSPAPAVVWAPVSAAAPADAPAQPVPAQPAAAIIAPQPQEAVEVSQAAAPPVVAPDTAAATQGHAEVEYVPTPQVTLAPASATAADEPPSVEAAPSASAGTAEAVAASAAAAQFYVKPVQGMRVRVEPTAQSPSVSILNQNALVSATGRRGMEQDTQYEWVEISGTDAEGQPVSGWARSGNLRAASEGPAPAPPSAPPQASQPLPPSSRNQAEESGTTGIAAILADMPRLGASTAADERGVASAMSSSGAGAD